MGLILDVSARSLFPRKKNVQSKKEFLQLATIGDKTSNARIRWFGHIKRRNIGAPMQMRERIVLLECKMGRKKKEMERSN